MASTQDLTVLAYVWGRYTHFVPTFVASTLLAWPGCYVKILWVQTIPRFDRSLAYIRKNISNRFQIVPWDPPGNQSTWMTRRWAYMPVDTRYAYIADLDMVHARTDNHIMDFHLDRMERSGQPYSNATRKNQKQRRGQLDKRKHATGLHFVDMPAYWPKFQEIAPPQTDAFWRMHNEKALYVLMQRMMGLPPYTFRPLHGLHLAELRKVNCPRRLIAADNRRVKRSLANPITEWRHVYQQYAAHAGFCRVLDMTKKHVPQLAVLDRAFKQYPPEVIFGD